MWLVYTQADRFTIVVIAVAVPIQKVNFKWSKVTHDSLQTPIEMAWVTMLQQKRL